MPIPQAEFEAKLAELNAIDTQGGTINCDLVCEIVAAIFDNDPSQAQKDAICEAAEAKGCDCPHCESTGGP